ncbi:serine hydrolase domain-containing protein [Arsukibacterium indicum]|uniref:Beta-lactamase family protein n=1 Tax=Arsukibacterium indicum TaxID=2848612 RepID=A0ABS6MNV2_9GAMM|nr:serine hydrolase domain-containing protein [Arsukibacterium indicum]MBV2130484.1 beta-lactamase family protein [Arsukibacterium indicum]
MRLTTVLLSSLLLLGCKSGDFREDCGGLPTIQINEKSTPIKLPILHNFSTLPIEGNVATSLEVALENALQKSEILQYDIVVKTPFGMWTSQNTEDGVEKFYWASVGKMFTAIAVYQLVDEERLKLDDRVSIWFPDFPHAERITIEMLLQHRTGIPSYNEFPYFSSFVPEPKPDEILNFMREQKFYYCPGSGWNYSNTNYVMLGEIISRVEGTSYQNSINTRFASEQTSFLSLDYDSYPSDVAVIAPIGEPQRLLKPSGPYAAGNIVASSLAMAEALESYLQSQMVDEARLKSMVDNVYQMYDSPMYYGDGIMTYEVGDDHWIGHSGGTPGANALLVYSKNSQAIVAIAFTGKGSAESIANSIFKVLE